MDCAGTRMLIGDLHAGRPLEWKPAPLHSKYQRFFPGPRGRTIWTENCYDEV